MPCSCASAASLSGFLDGRGIAFRMGGDEFCALFTAPETPVASR